MIIKPGGKYENVTVVYLRSALPIYYHIRQENECIRKAEPLSKVHMYKYFWIIYNLLSIPARCSSPGQCASGQMCLMASQM